VPEPGEVERPRRTGRLLYWGERRGPARFSFVAAGKRIEGRDGRFLFDLPPGRHAVRSMRAEGAVVGSYGDGPGETLDTHDAGPVLYLHRITRPAVRVVDAGTRQPVADARVYEHVPEPRWLHRTDYGFLHPGPATLARTAVRTGDDGRAVLPPGRGSRRLFVIAPGRRWTMAVADPLAADETEVALEPGCQLRVRVPDYDRCPEVNATWRTWSRNWPRLPLAGPDTHLVGLPPGWIELHLRRGFITPRRRWGYPSPRVAVGRREVTLTTGRAAAVTFDPWVEPDTWLYEVRGEVSLAADWPEGARGIVVHYDPPVSVAFNDPQLPYEVTRAPVRDGRFVIRGLRKGEHAFEVVPTGFVHVEKVERAGRPVNIAVPSPVRARVALVDADTGEPVPGAGLVVRRYHGELPVDVTPEGAAFLTTRGFHWLQPEAPRHFAEDVRVDIDEDPFRHEIRMAPGAELIVRVERDGVRVPVSGVELTLRDGSGWNRRPGLRRGAVRVTGLAPGPYAFGAPDSLAVRDVPSRIVLAPRERRVLVLEAE